MTKEGYIPINLVSKDTFISDFISYPMKYGRIHSAVRFHMNEWHVYGDLTNERKHHYMVLPYENNKDDPAATSKLLEKMGLPGIL